MVLSDMIDEGFGTLGCCALAVLIATLIGGSTASKGHVDILSASSGLLRALGAYISRWRFLTSGSSVVQQAFDGAKGRPFEVHAPDHRYLFVSSPAHVRDVDSASPEVLSLFAATKQMLQPRYTMHGFDWPDVRGAEGLGFIKALRTMLTGHLPNLIPRLDFLLSEKLSQIIGQAKGYGAGKKLHAFEAISRLVVLANAYTFFGEALAFDEEFLQYALTTTDATFKYAEVIRLLPEWLQPLAGRVVLRLSRSQAGMYQMLISAVERRLQEKSNPKLLRTNGIHKDCISWIIDTAPRDWPAHRIVFELIAIWFGSVHGIAITTTFAIYDLCLRPEYLEPLRSEIESKQYEAFKRTGSGLPLLDSFIKESARLSPIESMSGRRQAMTHFSFSDGTVAKKGDWICTPAGAIMRSETHYPQANEFHGFRFADPRCICDSSRIGTAQQQSPSKLTDVNENWHVWGIGRITCPGRFYAAAVIKTILAQLVRDYNIELVDRPAPRAFTWRTSMIPRRDSAVVLRSQR